MISFLAWWNPATWLSDADNKIIGAAIKMFRSIFYYISTFIYDLIIKLYNLFYVLCCGRLLDNEIAKQLTSRIGLILGILMFFLVSIAFIRMLIDPDSITDKVKGATSIIIKIFVVIICLGFSSFIFNSLYKVQRVVVQNNVISRILLPYEINNEDFGGALSSKLFMTFYNIDSNVVNIDSEVVNECRWKVAALSLRIREYNDFDFGLVCLNESVSATIDLEGEKVEQEMFVVNYNWFLSIIVGAVVAYFLFSYAITIGVRMIQLAFLEVVSPMAIVSHLMPSNDTPFKKWLKLYIATYVDVFIKIAIINFIMFLIAVMFDSAGSWEFWNSICLSDVCRNSKDIETMRNFVMIAMILALLTFAKKVPDLISKIIPNSDSGLSTKGFSFNDLMGGSLVKAGLMGTAAMGAGLGMYAASKGVGYMKTGTNALKNFMSKPGSPVLSLPKTSEERKKMLKSAAGVGIGALGFLGGGLMAAGRSGWAGKNSKGVFSAMSTGAKNESQARLAANQRAASGVSTGQYVSDRINNLLGLTGAYESIDIAKQNLDRVTNSYSNVPCNKTMADTIESQLNSVGIEREKTNAKYYDSLNKLGFTESKLSEVYKDNSQIIERFRSLESNPNKSASEIDEYNNLKSKLCEVFGDENSLSKFNEALNLKVENDRANDIFDERNIKIRAKKDQMLEAVIQVNAGATDEEIIKAVPGIKKGEDNKWYFEGIEVTQWDSIAAEISEYNRINGTNIKTLKEFKKLQGELAEKAVYARKSNK